MTKQISPTALNIAPAGRPKGVRNNKLDNPAKIHYLVESFLFSTVFLCRRFPDFDVILATSPPIFVAIAGAAVAWRRRGVGCRGRGVACR